MILICEKSSCSNLTLRDDNITNYAGSSTTQKREVCSPLTDLGESEATFLEETFRSVPRFCDVTRGVQEVLCLFLVASPRLGPRRWFPGKSLGCVRNISFW